MRGVLSGLVAGFAIVAALHFRRFGKRTGDRFFNLFAAAFLLFAVNNVGLGIAGTTSSGAGALYLIRLLAFLIILAAIVDKNRT